MTSKDTSRLATVPDPDTEACLLPLGVLDDIGGLDSALEKARADPHSAAAFLHRHRVVGLGLRRLDEEGVRSAEIDDLRRGRTMLDSMLESALDDMQGAVSGTGVAVAGIKGLAMRRGYDIPSDRDTGDVDVLCDKVDDAWTVVNFLRRRGYEWCQYEWPWLKRDPGSGRIYGQFQVWQELGEQSKRVDIHFGGYSVRHSRLAPVSLRKTGWSIMSMDANLPCLLGNAAGDFLVRLKDINDVQILLRQSVVPNALDDLESLGLLGFWSHLLDAARNPRGLRRGPWWSAAFTDKAALLGLPDKRRRLLATVRDAYRHGAIRGQWAGAVAGWSAFDYYRRDLRVSVGPCRHTAASPLLAELTNDVCVRLVPIDRVADAPGLRGFVRAPTRTVPADDFPIEGSEALRGRVAGGHTFLTAGAETFIPTVLYDLCDFECSIHRIDPPWAAPDLIQES